MILDEVDLRLDETGQPVPLASGAESTVIGIDSFLQDVRLEAVTTAGECFYNPEYGWSLLDFLHKEFGELEEIQIKNRVLEKLKNRDEINPRSILVTITQETNDIIRIHVEFKVKNDDVAYQMDLSIDGAEVTILD